MKPIVCLALVLPLFCLSAAVAADEGHQHHHDATEQLGKVSFPISCAPAVQKPFERGVALLHSFGYEEAEEQFQQVAKQDPSCAMAHWGVAMSLYHEIWERPQDTTLKRGWEEVQEAQKLGAKTGRERGYIAAVAAFYDPAAKDYAGRAGAYSRAMEKVYRQNPEDVEAGAFYALSLLAAEKPGDLSLDNPRKAVAILNQLYAANPQHPGLAHYIIHACDTPQLAPLGLDAARHYAEIAPSSAHALHMPSHIFARLGLWQEDIEANLKSVAAAHHSEAVYMHGHELHAMHFLEYAYLQTGQDDAARRIVEGSKQIVKQAEAQVGETTGMLHYYGFAAAHFPALYVLETRRWEEADALQPPANALSHIQEITYWARTIAAAHRGNLAAVRQNAKRFDELEEETRNSKFAYMLEGHNFPRMEVHAWLAFAEKKNDDGLRQMREAADQQDEVGKAEVDVPAREMLADMLLELDRPTEALAEYEKALKTDPNRFNGLYGAARAAELAHQPEKANTYYAQLLKNCGDGRSDRPELSRAKSAMAKAGQ